MPHHHRCHQPAAGQQQNRDGSSPSAVQEEGNEEREIHSPPAPLPSMAICPLGMGWWKDRHRVSAGPSMSRFFHMAFHQVQSERESAHNTSGSPKKNINMIQGCKSKDGGNQNTGSTREELKCTNSLEVPTTNPNTCKSWADWLHKARDFNRQTHQDHPRN